MLYRGRGGREEHKKQREYIGSATVQNVATEMRKDNKLEKNPSFIATMKSQKYPSPAKFPAHFDNRFAAPGVSLHPQTGGTSPRAHHAQA